MPKKKTARVPAPESLLVELLTEELPPKSLKLLSDAFGHEVLNGLIRHQLMKQRDSREARVFATPRRLAVIIPDVLAKAGDRENEVTGPSLQIGLDAQGKPTPALIGFARKNGIAVDALEQRETPKGKVFLARVKIAGGALDHVLEEIVRESLRKLPIPKVMRWGDSDAQFVRPAHGLVMMHGKRVVSGEVLGLKSRNYTLGHRFLNKGEIRIPAADQYESVLDKQGSVIACFDTRRKRIRAELVAAATGSKPLWDDALLDEVTALVEFPVVYQGSFSPEFLSVPQECLILSMKQHQRYFPLADASGKLLSKFLIVSNLKTKDPANIIHGNERVLRARLADAKFFYDQDRKMRLEERVPRLAHVVYHNKLGSQLDRVKRIEAISDFLAARIDVDVDLARESARLSKADLLTDMVGEFPELQGLMGGYYAEQENKPKPLVQALKDQYLQRFDESVDPDNLVSVCLYLADRAELLVGMFGIGNFPTGEKDPFGLRRAALGIIRVFELLGAAGKISGRDMPDVGELLEVAVAQFPHGMLSLNAAADVHAFILERYWNNLATVFRMDKDVVEAVICLRPRLMEIKARVDAVQTFRELPDAESLAAANKRIRNILRKSDTASGGLDEALLKEPAERALYDSMKKIEPQVESNMLRRDYAGSLKLLAGIRGVVDKFFDDVLVNAEDLRLRANRLALLRRLDGLMNRVADISKLAS